MRRLFGMALIATTMACGLTARAADETELDPGKVSDSFKAIFQFGSVSTKQALNANTVTLISGTIGGTYVQFGADLASVLDDGNKLRVLPIVGRGSVQSVADILFLQGVDLGIVRADTLDYLERKGFAKDIKKQFTYVTKLYNEEMHVIASKSIRSLRDLDGKTVSVDLPNGGTFVTALTVPSAEIPFTMRDGQLRVSNTTLIGEGARLNLSGGYDIAADQMDVRAALSATATDTANIGRPEILVLLFGSPDRPDRSLDVAALSSWLGLRAIGKILPIMQNEVDEDGVSGAGYHVAAKRAGYDHAKLPTGEQLDRLPYYGEWLQDEVVGSGDPHDGKEKRFGRFPNPTVHIGLGQLRCVVNELISSLDSSTGKALGPPAEISVEFTRALKLSDQQKAEKQREQRRNQEKNEKRRERIREFLGENYNPSATDLLKMRLWEELSGNDVTRECIYTGEPIGIRRLLSEEVDIDHILPVAMTLDDSAANKIICMRYANRHKRKQTPFEAFGTSPALQGFRYDWEAIAARAAGLPRYEVSNHAAPGGESRHNLTYWRYGDYAGIGPGAHGRRLAQATERHKKPENFIAAVERNGHGLKVETDLPPHERATEAMLMGLRLTEGIDLACVEERSGLARQAFVDADAAARLAGQGLLGQDGDRLAVTDAGILLLDSILAEVVRTAQEN